MNIGLFGGTFDPVHQGHLLMAEMARESFDLQKVLFVPAGLPPHRPQPGTSARDRLAMVRLAIGGNPSFAASDWEIRRGRVVYSYETLERFTAAFPKDHLYFIAGSDSLIQIPSWRQGSALLSRYDFLIVERPGAPWARIPQRLRRQAHRVPSEPVPFAGHEIRDRVRRGLSIRYQVPEAVDRYIRTHRLYRKPE
jgi:nicotinate-nucleotide adenylyltransferase